MLYMMVATIFFLDKFIGFNMVILRGALYDNGFIINYVEHIKSTGRANLMFVNVNTYFDFILSMSRRVFVNHIEEVL